MSGYLDRIGAGYVIKDPGPLDFDYVPENIVGREDFQNKLAARFSSIDKPETVSSGWLNPRRPILINSSRDYVRQTEAYPT